MNPLAQGGVGGGVVVGEGPFKGIEVFPSESDPCSYLGVKHLCISDFEPGCPPGTAAGAEEQLNRAFSDAWGTVECACHNAQGSARACKLSFTLQIHSAARCGIVKKNDPDIALLVFYCGQGGLEAVAPGLPAARPGSPVVGNVDPDTGVIVLPAYDFDIEYAGGASVHVDASAVWVHELGHSIGLFGHNRRPGGAMNGSGDKPSAEEKCELLKQLGLCPPEECCAFDLTTSDWSYIDAKGTEYEAVHRGKKPRPKQKGGTTLGPRARKFSLLDVRRKIDELLE